MFIWNHEDWLIAYPEGLQPTQWNCPDADKTSRDGVRRRCECECELGVTRVEPSSLLIPMKKLQSSSSIFRNLPNSKSDGLLESGAVVSLSTLRHPGPASCHQDDASCRHSAVPLEPGDGL